MVGPKPFLSEFGTHCRLRELWVGLCSLLQHLNEFWVLLCLSYGPIISFFFKQYISEMSLLQIKHWKKLHFTFWSLIQCTVACWGVNLKNFYWVATSYQIPDAIYFHCSTNTENAYLKMPKVFCDIDTPYSMSDRYDH